MQNQTAETDEDCTMMRNNSCRLILNNDDLHTFSEVIELLSAVLHCPKYTAEQIAYKVHSKGQCTIYVGEPAKCMELSALLEGLTLGLICSEQEQYNN